MHETAEADAAEGDDRGEVPGPLRRPSTDPWRRSEWGRDPIIDAPRRAGSRATNEQRHELEARVAEWISNSGGEGGETCGAETAPLWLVEARRVSTAPLPIAEAQPFVVVLFAGPPNRPDGLAAELRRLDARVVEVDVLIGGRLHDPLT